VKFREPKGRSGVNRDFPNSSFLISGQMTLGYSYPMEYGPSVHL
jgi:hypothetical protein